MSKLFHRLADGLEGNAAKLRPHSRLPFQQRMSLDETSFEDGSKKHELPEPDVEITPRNTQSDTQESLGHNTVVQVSDTDALSTDKKYYSKDKKNVSDSLQAPERSEQSGLSPQYNDSVDAYQQSRSAFDLDNVASNREPGAQFDKTGKQTGNEPSGTGLYLFGETESATTEYPQALLAVEKSNASNDLGRKNSNLINHQPQPALVNVTRDRTGAGSPNEVHVHIGRIEVTAVQDAPKKTRTSRIGHLPMSLDDYVKQRKRGER